MNARVRYRLSPSPEGIRVPILQLLTRLFATLAIVGAATVFVAVGRNSGLADRFSEVHAMLFFGVFVLSIFALRLAFGQAYSVRYPIALLASRLRTPLAAFGLAATLPLTLWYRRTSRRFELIARANTARQHFSASHGETWTELVRRTQLHPILVVFGNYDDSIGEMLAVLVRKLGLHVKTRDFDRFIEPGPEESVLILCIDNVQADLLRAFASEHGRRRFVGSLEDAIDHPSAFSAELEGLLMDFSPTFCGDFSEYFREWLALFAVKSARERLRLTAEDHGYFERRREAS